MGTRKQIALQKPASALDFLILRLALSFPGFLLSWLALSSVVSHGLIHWIQETIPKICLGKDSVVAVVKPPWTKACSY
jgi:hypothetical protein